MGLGLGGGISPPQRPLSKLHGMVFPAAKSRGSIARRFAASSCPRLGLPLGLSRLRGTTRVRLGDFPKRDPHHERSARYGVGWPILAFWTSGHRGWSLSNGILCAICARSISQAIARKPATDSLPSIHTTTHNASHGQPSLLRGRPSRLYPRPNRPLHMNSLSKLRF